MQTLGWKPYMPKELGRFYMWFSLVLSSLFFRLNGSVRRVCDLFNLPLCAIRAEQKSFSLRNSLWKTIIAYAISSERMKRSCKHLSINLGLLDIMCLLANNEVNKMLWNKGVCAPAHIISYFVNLLISSVQNSTLTKRRTHSIFGESRVTKKQVSPQARAAFTQAAAQGG